MPESLPSRALQCLGGVEGALCAAEGVGVGYRATCVAVPVRVVVWQAEADTIGLVVKATDEFGYPHIECTGCAQVKGLKVLAEAAVGEAIDTRIAEPWTGLEHILGLLTLTGKAAFVSGAVMDRFLVCVVPVSRGTNTHVLCLCWGTWGLEGHGTAHRPSPLFFF